MQNGGLGLRRFRLPPLVLQPKLRRLHLLPLEAKVKRLRQHQVKRRQAPNQGCCLRAPLVREFIGDKVSDKRLSLTSNSSSVFRAQ